MSDHVEVAPPVATAGPAEPSPSSFDETERTVVARLYGRARSTPDRLAYTWLADGETEAETLTWGALRARAEGVAQGLAAAGIDPGDRALLLFPPGLDFLVGFVGCLLARVVAVPAYPPRSLRRPEREGERLAGVAADAAPRAVLTTPEIAAAGPSLAAGVPALLGLPWLSFSSEPAEPSRPRTFDPSSIDPASIDPTSTAFLQYTSGSTSEPKGVIVSHANLAANLEMIRQAFSQDEHSIVVGWLPLYHDMGLIGNVLQPLWSGGRCVLMSPVSFLQRPARWLEAIDRYRATTSGGPDFAYALAARKVTAEEAERLNLSSWQIAFSGAEPVRAETLAAFAGKFAPSGFRREAFYPCYGLAEATLFVAGPKPGRLPNAAEFDAQSLEAHEAIPAGLEPEGEARAVRSLVSCGHAWAGQQIAIVDPESARPCPSGRIGEIWVSGPSIAAGYRNRPEAKAETFGARLVGSAEQYLRTGDLGFLHEGELFVTGRRKDLVILRGRNHYPQDLERTAEAAHPDLVAGNSAAFSIEGEESEERLVLVAEVSRHARADAGEIVEAIRTAIAERHEVQAADVRLLAPGALPKTTSGKVRRGAARTAYLAGTLAEIEASQKAVTEGIDDGGASREALVIAAARSLRLPVERLDVNRPLTAQGLDSLSGIEFQLAAEKLGYAVSIADLLDGASLADLLRGPSWVRGRPARHLLQQGGPEARAPRSSSPLSLEQEGLWAAERLAPSAYTIAMAALVEDLDAEALVRAVEAAIARHPALGARFSAGEAGAIQTFAPPRLETIRERAEPAHFTERIGAIAMRPFDLGVGPLVRLVLIEGDQTAIGFAVHHLVADFTSLALLAGEVAAIYSAEVASRLPKLPPLSEISLGDLIVWRNERLATLDRGEGSAFAGRLAALSAVEDLDLPTDRPRPPRQSFRGFLRSLPLSAAALGLERLARSSDATPFALLTAAFSAFLHRTTGQSRFALAAPTAGRSAPGLESLVGYLVQPAAIPFELEDDASFAVHLERTRRASAAAVASAESVPFATLVDRLRPRRDPARPPLAQVAVAYERAGDLAAFGLGIEGAEIDLGGVRLRALPLPERRVPFELALHAAQVGETLHLALQGNAELFDPATIGRWLGQLGRLLADMAERPAARLSELNLFSAAERAELLASAAGSHRPAPPTAAIQLDDLVAHWEAATPEALAVADSGRSLTYGELGARANRLAWRLRELGIAEESRVAVCLDRSVDLIVAELAALRAGAAFAPIDPAYPEARRGDMVALSGAAAVVTLSHLAGSWCGAAKVLALDAEPALRSTEPVAAPPRRKNPEGLAYAIFTSGSTGRPKGVAMSHRGALHIVSWHLERFGWTGADRGSQVSGPSFDAAVIEIWPALAAGASLHVPHADVRLSAPDLLAWFARERLTVAWSPTPLVELFAGEPQPAGLLLRFLQTGGDRLLQGAPADAGYVLCNQYGPAENAVITTQGESAAADGRAGAVPPIGRPISGVRAYVLDRWQGLAPRGSGGELGVAGEGLARGYLDDPAQTAERFVPDPFSGETGGRMYRTGDRVRQRPDGALDFLGRIDRQVKIRGQRIELGEIEAALLADPQVAAATVVLFGAGAGARLAAYVVRATDSLDVDRLRANLRTKLPGAMVPSAFVELAALPLTPNGKIDRRALPEPQFGGEVGESFEPARSPVEEILAAIFGEVLGVERPIGRRDDLLALGLHSLTATRAAARASRVFGRELPLAALFETPTVGALAEMLTEGSGGAAPLPAIVAGGRGERAPLTFPQRRLWFLERLQPGRATYHIAGAVDLSGGRDEAALDGALVLVIARHEALRTAIPDEEGEPFQVPAAEVFEGCPRIDLAGLGAEEAEIDRLSRSLARLPFKIAAGPLVRFAEIVRGKAQARLVAIFHHLICDGAALDLFLGELFAAYAALAAGDTPNLPPADFQLADIARWQAGNVIHERTAEPLAHFRARLADLEPLDLPSDRPRGARRSGRGQTVAARFDGGLARRLATRACSAGATPFMLWVAALHVLIARISGRGKTAIGTPIANRRSPEMERVFGFVANTLVLDAETGDDPTAAELIDRVRVGALAAYAREDLPFELLVEALAPRRDLAQNPLFDVLISLEPPLGVRHVGALDITPVRLDTGTAKLDLSLAVVPAAEGFEVWAEHDADLFDSTTIARWLGGYERLLGALADGTDLRVSDLPLLAAEEVRQLISWSGEEKSINEGELLPNGKIDRRALPALAGGIASSTEYVAPRNETEARLAEVFAEVLGRERVGAFDDFFALGGHSLLAARAAARIARAFGVRDLALSLLFEAPTVAGLGEKLSKEEKLGAVALPPIVAVDRPESGLPLAFAQERLWFLEQLAPGLPTYHLAGAVEIAGRFDTQGRARFAAALALVVARHEILRTALRDGGAGPRQVVLPPLTELFLPLADLGAIPARASAAESERLARAVGSLPFDLSRGQTLRAAVLRTSSESNLLAVSLHHAVADGASLGLLISEVAEIYSALTADRAPRLPPLPIQFADFSVWQRATLDGDALAPQLEAWRARLAGLPTLDLPTDRPRPAVRSGRGAIRERELSSALLSRLDAWARAAGASRFQALVAVAQGLLARLTGEPRIPLGTPVSNRPRIELEPLIGMFVNTLVLDVEVADDPTAGVLLARARASALAALALRDLPFERLVEEISPRRDTAQNPLFQALFVLEEPLAPPSGITAGALRLTPRRLDVGTSRFDLTLEATPAGSALVIAAEYDADLFDAETIDRWLGGYERLLAAFGEGSQRRLSDLPLLAPEEVAQLAAWSGEKSISEAGLLHARFFRVAERTPNAPALVGADETWSYSRLAERALAIAGGLGIAPEERVGVLLSRGPELVAAILGVLAAGGVYVPLDPAYPQERLRFLLEDSGAEICITEDALAALVPGDAVVLLEDLADGREGAASSAPTTGGETETGYTIGGFECRGAACCALAPTPRHLAYLIYTSGSTGRPKSVAIEHGTAAGFISWALASFSPDELSSVLFSTSVCFDLSIFELFAPLSSGGALVLALNALDLPAAASRHAVTLINTVPSALAELVRSAGLPGSVLTVNLAGEALPGALVERIFASSPSVVRVNNLYGPSEDTTYSTWSEIRRSAEFSPRTNPSIGRPLPGTQCHVVGRRGELAIPGVPGELRLGGSGLARGYLGRPDLTAERFLPDPFSNVAGARLYATGDRVRWIARGEDRPELEYLGRIDHQVKVRGFRVELGEVEAALAAAAGVREAAAAVVGEGAERRLVGFVATNREVRFDEEGLLAALRSRLPEYLVPSLLTPLDALPRLPNGKVDRQALPALAGAAGQRLYVPPRGPVEAIVAEIFAEVLESAPRGGEPAAAVRIGAHDGFFALGGHSLLAARAVSRLRATFGVELPLKRLFERPTVAQIAAEIGEEIERRRSDGPAEAAAPLWRLPAGAERPLSFAQERLWFLDRLGAGVAYNLPGAVRLAGPLRPAVLRAALAEVVSRHEGLRSRFPEREGRPILEIAPPGAPPLPLTDLAGLVEVVCDVELRRLVRAEAALPFDLAAGPLVRARLVRLAEDRHVVLFDHHHAVSDGWSIGLLLDEIGRLYPAWAAGGFAALPELPIEVADFAAWQRARLAPGPELDRLLGFWRGELADVPTVLALPTDRPRPGVFSTRGLAVPVSLGPELSADLAAFCRSRGATPFALLLAGFGALLGRWVEPEAGRAPLLLGTPIAGRDRPEIERLIGFFANILPLRIDRLGADGTEGSFGALLDRVRARALDAFSHPDLPFDVLVEDLVPRRDPSRPPLVQAAFNWQAVNPWHGARWGDLELASLGDFGAIGDFGAMAADVSAEVTAKFELMLVLERGSEGIAGHLEVHADLFERTTALRWAGQFERLLAAAVADPDGTAWGDLALLSPPERHQLLIEWRDGDEPQPSAPWHERVAAWAERAPDRPAAFLGDAMLSYGELDARSRTLAAQLRVLGLAPEDRVAIALDRSFEALIAILGILRAGCAYVAIDPEYPAERIAFLLGDSGARALVRGSRRLGNRWDGVDLPVLVLDDASPGLVPPLAPIRFDPEQLAYIVYTSGSTGLPKGVATPHRAVDAYVWAQTALLDLGPDDCMLQFSPLGFDGSVEEIFAPLAAGAALALRSSELPGARELLRMFAERRVSVAFLPTGYWTQLASAIAAEDLEIPTTLREVRFGGELGLGETAREVRRRAPGLRLANVYGPTETTVIITHWALPEAAEIPATLPLGRPLPHARAAVVDGALRPVPRGAVGELVFGGPSLARGYWARPELAADRFVPDPFAAAEGRAGERLYRTGDLARHAPDGILEFLGRAEGAGGQVKLRGFRIELGEIEAALASHGQIGAAVAAVVKKAGQEDRLVAWVAAPPTAAPAPSSADLAAYLAERLPAQLIPSGIVVLAELPLNTNGKVDRRALPPFTEAKERTFPDRPADGSLEATLAGIWTELFGASGRDDNFFDLGASSLSLVRLHSRIQADLGREFPLVTLFQHPTLRSLAKSLGEAGTSAAAEREAAEVSAARERSAGRREGLAELERRRSRARRRI